jgi:hypothetical protein
LATTGKTGCLHVEGDRGRGSVWLHDGSVVGATAERALGAAPIDEVIFEMLRFGRGSFNFAADELAPEDNPQPKEVEKILRRSTQLLDEWRSLEGVVPSLSHRVALAPELTVEQVTIDAPRWEALVAIASGRSVGELAEKLSLGELGVSRTVSDLVELGVAVVEPPGAARAPSVTSRRNANDASSRPLGGSGNGGGGEQPTRVKAPSPSGLESRRDSREPREPHDPREQVSASNTSNDNGRANWLDESAKAPVETAPKPRGAKSSSGTTRPRPRRTGPTPTSIVPPSSPLTAPPRNGQTFTGAVVSPPLGTPPASPPMGTPTALSPTLPPMTAPVPQLPAPPLTERRSMFQDVPPGPSPEALRGPILPPSLDTGRLGPSPLPMDTGQIPSVSAASLPPDLSWAAEDNGRLSPAPLSPLAPAPMTPGPLTPGPMASGPVTPARGSMRSSAPGRLLSASHSRTPSNGRHDSGDTAPHVGAMSPEARAAVESTIGRSGGGPGGMPMAGATQEQVLSRGQLLKFLSSVRQ